MDSPEWPFNWKNVKNNWSVTSKIEYIHRFVLDYQTCERILHESKAIKPEHEWTNQLIGKSTDDAIRIAAYYQYYTHVKFSEGNFIRNVSSALGDIVNVAEKEGKIFFVMSIELKCK